WLSPPAKAESRTTAPPRLTLRQWPAGMDRYRRALVAGADRRRYAGGVRPHRVRGQGRDVAYGHPRLGADAAAPDSAWRNLYSDAVLRPRLTPCPSMSSPRPTSPRRPNGSRPTRPTLRTRPNGTPTSSRCSG